MEYTIKQVADELEISIHTLRYYDKEGLLPTIQRNHNNHRVFSKEDMEWIYMIKALRDTRMKISDIKQYLQLIPLGKVSVKKRKIILEKHQQIIEKQLKTYQFIQLALEEKLVYYERIMGEEDMKCYDYKDEWENFKKLIGGLQ